MNSPVSGHRPGLSPCCHSSSAPWSPSPRPPSVSLPGDCCSPRTLQEPGCDEGWAHLPLCLWASVVPVLDWQLHQVHGEHFGRVSLSPTSIRAPSSAQGGGCNARGDRPLAVAWGGGTVGREEARLGLGPMPCSTCAQCCEGLHSPHRCPHVLSHQRASETPPGQGGQGKDRGREECLVFQCHQRDLFPLAGAEVRVHLLGQLSIPGPRGSQRILSPWQGPQGFWGGDLWLVGW